MNKFLIGSVSVLVACGVLAQSPQGVRGWRLSGNNPSYYEILIDRSSPHSGQCSGTIRNVKPVTADERNVFGTLMQNIRPDLYKGKRVRLSAFVRTEDAGGARLWMRVDGVDHPLSFDNKESEKITGTKAWITQVIVLDVPETATGIAFGLILEGNGQASLDDVAFEIVDASVASTNLTEAVKSIRENYSRMTPQQRSSRPGRDYSMAVKEIVNANFEN